MNEGKINSICKELLQERRNQFERWGDQDHNFPTWMSIITEEVGESAREANDFHFSADAEVRKDKLDKLREELVQTASVTIQVIEKIDELKKLEQ